MTFIELLKKSHIVYDEATHYTYILVDESHVYCEYPGLPPRVEMINGYFSVDLQNWDYLEKEDTQAPRPTGMCTCDFYSVVLAIGCQCGGK